MEAVLLGQARGAGESNLLQRLLRDQRRSGRHGGWRDRMQPAWVTALRKTVHLGHIFRAVVDVVLGWDARCGVWDLCWWALVMLRVGGVT